MSRVRVTKARASDLYELLSSPAMELELDRQGRRIAAELRSVASSTAHDTGDYAAAFDVEHGRDRTRSFVRVTNDDPAWVFVEYGGRHTPARRIFRRVLERMAR